MSDHVILGLDIGGTKTAAVLGTSRGDIRMREEIRTGAARGFAAVFADISRLAETVLHRVSGCEAISVSIGGPLDVERGIILSPPNLPGWDRIELKRLLAERFRLPVYVEHDGNAGALAEWYFGAGRGARTLIFLTMGTGFGAGLILDGRLFRGASDVAGEIGHVRIAEEGPDCYGKAGSLEGYASGTGIVRLAGMMAPGRWSPGFTVKHLADEARAGDAEARAVFDRAALYLGRGFAMLIDTLNPEKIIVGGIGMRLTDILLTPACRVAEAEALPAAWNVCSIVPAGLGEGIGDIAALCGALNQGELFQN